MKKIILLLVFIFSIVNASALLFYSGECFNDGHARITVNAGDNDSKVYTSQITTKVDGMELDYDWSVDYMRNSNDGKRKYGFLETDEGIFNEKKEYKIEITYFIEDDPEKKIVTGEMDCPGLRFSCALLNLTIDQCYTKEGKFIAELTILGIEQSAGVEREPDVAVKYNLIAEKRYEDSIGNNKEEGLLPAGYTIIKKGKGKYRIEAPFVNNKVKEFYARYDLNEFIRYCDSSNYPGVSFWDKLECDQEEVVEALDDSAEEKVEAQIDDTPEDTKKDVEFIEPERESAEVVQTNTGSVKTLVIITVIVVIFVIVGLFYLKKKGQM